MMLLCTLIVLLVEEVEVQLLDQEAVVHRQEVEGVVPHLVEDKDNNLSRVKASVVREVEANEEQRVRNSSLESQV